MENPDVKLPHPLTCTSGAFVGSWAGRVRALPPVGFTGDPRPVGGERGAVAIYRAFYREGLAEALRMAVALDTEARAALATWQAGVLPVSQMLREQSPEGEVVKFLSVVEGGLAAESVLIPMLGGAGESTHTLCVSSQIGCAMGCTFCETAQMGLMRSLSSAEIVGQWWNAAHTIGVRPKNIVFMGMGEPMDNLDNVLDAIDILRDHSGPHVAVSQITISTVGRVDGIERLAQHIRQPGLHRLGLALSLNAPNDADRSAIMPVNRKWNLAALQEALLRWARSAGSRQSGNKVCVEYVLIPGVNDSERHAEEIARFIEPFGLCVDGKVNGKTMLAVLNLIPYNPRRNSPWPAPSEEQVEQFMRWLIERGVFVKRRRTKGREMMGACGQLGSEHIRRRKMVALTVKLDSQFP